MLKRSLIISSVLVLFSVVTISFTPSQGSNVNNENKTTEISTAEATLTDTQVIYNSLEKKNTASMPSEEAFTLAIKGFNNLKAVPGKVKKDILTVVDFSLPSTEKRLWVIDLSASKVLFNDYVAHGRNTGNNLAEAFSNVPNSYASSIGFYMTAETYHGKHGLSLRLDGMDKGFNDNARSRAIVLHGADYVSNDFIEKYGRLGRSYGCPSVSMDIYEDVIGTISEGSLLFIYSPDEKFVNKSTVLNSVKTNQNSTA